ncbi:hypothetical protein [Streptomyces lichenis]|uniref:Sortase n=1 Tax=Streptomyces lichenis TaxID=2306967 RepID=A0ABT0I5L6_9ACTN|nr:hypothetical protein [Streptomyces lichenis]MCK8676605.1 hypothetical protein [Streptomyces lichenis]
MRSALFALRAPLAVAGAAGALVLSPAAGAAHAGDGADRVPVRAFVAPATAVPGAGLEVEVLGCPGGRGEVRSPAFFSVAELSGRDGAGRPLYGSTTVASHARAGGHPMDVVCGGRTHHDAGRVQVAHQPPVSHARGGGPNGTAAPVSTDEPLSLSAAQAPIDLGAADEQGPGTPHTVIGLVLAGVAAVAVALRTSRRRRETRSRPE